RSSRRCRVCCSYGRRSTIGRSRSYFIIFFFQAEDGIRDKLVTGVQTCALPICSEPTRLDRTGEGTSEDGSNHTRPGSTPEETGRSEERRVGKECRSRWSPDH